jgi:predicted RNA-binding protein
MCLAKAYLGEAEENEIILKDVATVKIDGGKLNLRSFFGEQKEIEGTIKEINFQSGKIIIEKAA